MPCPQSFVYRLDAEHKSCSKSQNAAGQEIKLDLAEAADLYTTGDITMKDAHLMEALYDKHGSKLLTSKVWQNIDTLFLSRLQRDNFANYDFAQDPVFFLGRKLAPLQDFLIDRIFREINSENDEEVLATVLLFLHQMVLTREVSLRGLEIDRIYGILLHPTNKIADAAASILVSSTANVSSEVSLPMWWATIKKCLVSRPQIAYKAWIGWSLSFTEFTKGQKYKELLCQSEYWDLLRKGITVGMNSCECTKYCLRILSTSLKDLTYDLDLPIMSWKYEEKQKYLSVWSRYVALVEILCIDTSLNQAEDSAAEIVALLHPESLLPDSWAISLLEAGLTSNIRDFVYNLVLELGEPLRIFNSDPQFLARKLVPSALQASNFFVEEGRCAYKEKISAFVARLCTYLEPEPTNIFITTLMEEFLLSIRSYEAPRVIITNALLTSLSCPLSFSTVLAVAHYGGAALQGYKSEAMGKLILSNCLRIILKASDASTLSVSEGLKVVDKLIINGIETIDLVEVAGWMPKSWIPELKIIASSKAAYRILYALKSNDCFVPPDQEAAEKVLSYFADHQLRLEDSLQTIQLISAKLSSGHHLCYDEYNVLSKASIPVSVPTPGASGLVGKLGYLQATNLGESLPSRLLLNLLDENGDAKGFMSGEMRFLHCQGMLHIFNQIDVVDEKDWPVLVDLVERAFLHDETVHRIAALSCLERSINSLSLSQIEASGDVCSSLSTIWFAFKEVKLKASEHSVHVKFIQVLSNPKVVKLQRASEVLESVALDIIRESYARRDLMAPLIQGLTKTPCLWVSRVTAFAYCFLQTNMQSFHLEELIVKETGRYSDYWNLPDKAARVFAIKYFSFGHNAKEVTDYLLEDKSFALLSPGKRHDGDEERVRILAYQLLTLLSPRWDNETARKVLKYLLERAVDVEPSPSARIHVEWIMALILVKNPQELSEEFVLTPLRNNSAPRYVSSLGRVGLLVGKQVTTELKPKFYEDYLSVMLPLATSNRAPVRHFAVAMVYAIHLDTGLRNCVNPLLLTLVDGVASSAASVENFKDFKSGDDCVWSVSKSMTFLEICGGLAHRVTGRVIRDRLFLADFVDALGPGDYGIEEEKSHPVTSFHSISMIRDSIRTANNNIQTKSGSFDGTQEPERSELIVVATLCDKPTNLGGICRLCDALGVKLMTLNDLSVSKHPQFKSTAVTADKWMPMQQVTEADLLSYLQEKKREGYTLVGIEQTDNSRKLKPDLKFPVKTVLVMGKEREGVPGEVLAHLDFCVEIEQFGMVRSMNIQTATAVLVHAYNNQH